MRYRALWIQRISFANKCPALPWGNYIVWGDTGDFVYFKLALPRFPLWSFRLERTSGGPTSFCSKPTSEITLTCKLCQQQNQVCGVVFTVLSPSWLKLYCLQMAKSKVRKSTNWKPGTSCRVPLRNPIRKQISAVRQIPALLCTCILGLW